MKRLTRSKSQKPVEFQSVTQGLRELYKTKLRPLEERFLFYEFHSPLMSDADFTAKPMVLLVGQHSTGKTTFIKHLLEQDFPGLRIGPVPTAESFTVVMHGEQDQVIPGNALVVDPFKQFRSLGTFGNAFLNRLYCLELPNKMLESITIVDTPGILSGDEQRVSRDYDFSAVLKWFAERADRIILLFDAHKLEISDEFRRCIDVVRQYEKKVRIVLDKADTLTSKQLLKVNGDLMWSLSKAMNSPEVPKVYAGSLWEQSLQSDEGKKLFQAEASDLFADIQSLPRTTALRKLNDFVKRARLAKAHAHIISNLRKRMPVAFGKSVKKEKLIDNLEDLYRHIQIEHNISPGDLPPISEFQAKLKSLKFSKLHTADEKLFKNMKKMLENDLPQLMAMIPHENGADLEAKIVTDDVSTYSDSNHKPFAPPEADGDSIHNPTTSRECDEGMHHGISSNEWAIASDKEKYDAIFATLGPDTTGRVSRENAEQVLSKSELPDTVLGRIWELADVDKDGMLDSDEFAVAMYLINIKHDGKELPEELPSHVVPPSKRSTGPSCEN